MKHIILTTLIVLACLSNTKAQDADSMPYQRYGMLPSYEVLELDSSNVFSTYKIPDGKPIVIIYFSPDCDHCEQLTKSIIEHMDEFKKTRIYMITPMDLVQTSEFYNKLNLKEYKNIKVYKDFLFFGYKFFGFRSFPFAAVYNGNKNLVKGFPHKLTAKLLIEVVQEAKN